MPDNSAAPENTHLHLYEVLAEEYRNLHGPLPADFFADSEGGSENGSADESEKEIAINRKPVAQLYQRIHNLPETKKRSALCLSGGGIRSGTFALGVLQGLARHNLLDKFDYLSTVSGGGYIGGWLTAWMHRDPRGLNGVVEKLTAGQIDSPLEPEPETMRYLREYSNFVTPKVGLMSADTWSFIAIILRNLILNWLVLIPLLAAAIALPRVYVALLLHERPGVAVKTIFLLIGFVSAVVAVAYITLNRPSISDFHQPARGRSPSTQPPQRTLLQRIKTQKGFLRFCWVPLLLAVVCLSIYWAWASSTESRVTVWPFESVSLNWPWAFTLFGGVVCVLGWAIHRVWLRRFNPGGLLIGSVTLFLTGAVAGYLAWFLASNFGLPNSPPLDGGFSRPALYACLALPALLTLILLATTFYVGISSRTFDISLFGRTLSIDLKTDDEDREWWARFNAWLLIAILCWGALSSLVIFGPALLALEYVFSIVTPLGILSGLITLLVGRSAKTPAQEGQAKPAGRQSSLMSKALLLAAPLFLAFLVILLSAATSAVIPLLAGDPLAASQKMTGSVFWNRDAHLNIIHRTPVWLVANLSLLMGLFGLLMAFVINLNKFSLHAGYRNRLIRAYLGASRNKGARRPNLFTGFDPADNIQMHELRPGLLHIRELKNPSEFILKLQQGETNDGPFKYLFNELSDDVKGRVRAYSTSNPPTQSLQREVIEDLNRVLEGKNLSAQEGFATIYGSREFEELERAKRIRDWATDSAPDSSRLILLNRLLLEQVYPNEIATFPFPPPPYRLLHVVNLALNLVGGKKLAWQYRKAQSFSVTALHAGSYRLGYRRSKGYGGHDGISLGTAMTISGAAANPNMGYFSSSPLVTFLMTLFNVRLGWWLGNPGRAGKDTFNLSYPNLLVWPLVAEAFGLTDDRNSYVNLSDGGHFENLGLYEMVLRRCHFIVVSDGSQDPDCKFSDLGNAVRKIRIDLGVPIEFDDIPIHSRNEAMKNGKYCAIGRIRYSCVDANALDGILIYIKPAVYGKEPADIRNYAETNRSFPHETTADQFFSEPQFESYRALGSYAMEQICGEGWEAVSLEDFVKRIHDNHLDAEHRPKWLIGRCGITSHHGDDRSTGGYSEDAKAAGA